MLPEGKKKILDAGCGTFVWYIPDYEIHRCDNSQEIESMFRKIEMESFGKYNFKVVDLNKDLPYKDGEFDGVVAIELIEHLENPRHFLRECKRICKEFIIITTPNCLSDLSRKMFAESGRFFWFEEKDYGESGHITPLFLWQIEQMLKELNLKIQKIKYNNDEKEIMVLKIVR